MEEIKVWFYNGLSNEWIQKNTKHYKETKDELNYFRVINSGNKYFYLSFNDYLDHNFDIINNKYNHLITNINGELLYTINPPPV